MKSSLRFNDHMDTCTKMRIKNKRKKPKKQKKQNELHCNPKLKFLKCEPNQTRKTKHSIAQTEGKKKNN